ncbi:ABC transporter permease [Flavitalea sp.]|nr:ABC transporter permease [Flavitalea sp.]
MLKNYLLTAVRNFRHNKVFSLINILGLSIGITASLVIFMIVYYEFSFEKFQKDRDRIYRVVIQAKFNGSEGFSTGVPAPLSVAVKNEITGIDNSVPVMHFQGDSKVMVNVVSPGRKDILIKKQVGIIFTNTDYFELLGYKWLAGSPQSMSAPFSVVLTKSRAKQYFSGKSFEELIGAQIIYNKELTVKVAGIVDDLNQNTIFSSSEFISYPTIAKTRLQDNFMMNVWNDWMAYSQLYIKLAPGGTVSKTEAQLAGLITKYNKDVNRDAANTMAFKLQPLDDIHFNQKYPAIGQRLGHKPTLYGLLAIGAFLLVLGCINFINLTTAQASRRAREIGIRKTMGGIRKQLVFQFLSETFILTVIASILAVLLIPILLNMFGDFIPAGLEFSFFNQPGILTFFAILIISVTILSGLYPALVLSGFKPVLVLKNQVVSGTSQTRNAWLRKTLTVSQFLIAQFFVIATLMVSKQINYSVKADMGFDKDAVLNFNLPRDTVASHGRQLLADIKALPGVEVVSTGFLAPADAGVAFTNVKALINNKEVKPDVNVQLRWGNPEFIEVYKMKLTAGRNVRPGDTLQEFLINETFARSLGFKDPAKAIDHYLVWNKKPVPIVGILKDFHDISMHGTINSMIFGGQNGSTFHVRLKSSDNKSAGWQATIASMKKLFNSIYPEEDFSYSFLDDTIAKFYEREQNTAKLLTWATGLAIFISCLGLAGLVIYTTNNRKKEIGIRKVLGASVTGIVTNLSKDFIVLVLIAFVIAVPVAWWAVFAWLDNFVYRTQMSWWIFALAGIGMLFIALITVGLHTLKAAMSNPVESLRTE